MGAQAQPPGDFDVRGRVAVITGASEGIGRELAIGLARHGADLVLCSRSAERLEEMAHELAPHGGRVEPYALDVRDADAIAGLGTFCRERFGAVHALVNSAGHYFEKPAWDVTPDDWDQLLATSLRGTFFTAQAVGAVMREHGYGKIVNLASTFTYRTYPRLAIYAMVKAAVGHLTSALAVEWAADGVRVNALAPTAVMTPSRAASLQGEDLAAMQARIPLGRLAEPADLLNATIYLASAASDFVTGHTLLVDGGYVAAG